MKLKRLNNKGYMLVEIILASALAMMVAYFVIDLTIKLKNKNDDLLVKTLVSTDQAIIYNTIMKDLYNRTVVDCSTFNSSIDINNNVFKYTDRYGVTSTNIVTEYADLSAVTCSTNASGKIEITIPISVKQLGDVDGNFDVNIIK